MNEPREQVQRPPLASHLGVRERALDRASTSQQHEHERLDNAVEQEPVGNKHTTKKESIEIAANYSC